MQVVDPCAMTYTIVQDTTLCTEYTSALINIRFAVLDNHDPGRGDIVLAMELKVSQDL